jgi:Family of unknown function (DUF6151)
MTKALTHPLDVVLGCRCGRERGVASHVSPSTGLRFVCYCNDCHAFARFLDRRDVLNAAGGTDIFQNEVLGPPRCRIYARAAVGPLPPSAPSPPSLRVFARRASMLLGWWVRGLGQRTPFFDDRTKALPAVPRVLRESERGAVSLAPSPPSYPGPK